MLSWHIVKPWFVLMVFSENLNALMVFLVVLVKENHTGVCGIYLASYCWKYLQT